MYYPVIRQLKERHSRSCFLFAGHVMTSVKWAEILERVGNHEALSRSHATLFQLLIYMARENDLLMVGTRSSIRL